MGWDHSYGFMMEIYVPMGIPGTLRHLAAERQVPTPAPWITPVPLL